VTVRLALKDETGNVRGMTMDELIEFAEPGLEEHLYGRRCTLWWDHFWREMRSAKSGLQIGSCAPGAPAHCGLSVPSKLPPSSKKSCATSLWDPLDRPPPPQVSTTPDYDAAFLAWQPAGQLFDGID
jgi:hypothetical protein